MAQAGQERAPWVGEQIGVALAGFRAVLDVASVEDLAEEFRGKLVFRPGRQWPSIYHLRLLAFTRCWRGPENRRMLARAAGRLAELSPLPYIRARFRSQVVAPAAFGMLDFNADLERMSAAEWMAWFHRMECLARLGVAKRVPHLLRQVRQLKAQLDSRGAFARKLGHPYFANWGSYTGLRLETDWRDPRRCLYDLTFRSLLILHQAEAG